MAEDYLDLIGVGKTRTFSRTVNGLKVHDQAVFQAAKDTWYAYAEGAFASGKHHLTLFNGSGSGKVVKCRKLFATNLQVTAITGAVVRLNIAKVVPTNVPSGGTPAAVSAADPRNAALPNSITAYTNRTVPNPVTLFPWVTSSDEELAGAALSKGAFQQSINILPEGAELQETTLTEGHGLTIHQVGTHAGGSFGWLLVFTVEETA